MHSSEKMMNNLNDQQWSELLQEHAQFERSADLNGCLSERPQTAGEALQYAAQYGSIYCLNVALQYCGADFYSIECALIQAARNDDMHALETLLEYAPSELGSSEALQSACLNKNEAMVHSLLPLSDHADAINFLNEIVPSAAHFLQQIVEKKQAEQQKQLLDEAVAQWDGSGSVKRKM